MTVWLNQLQNFLHSFLDIQNRILPFFHVIFFLSWIFYYINQNLIQTILAFS